MQENAKDSLRALIKDAMRYSKPRKPRRARYRLPFWAVAVMILEAILLVGMGTVVASFQPAPDRSLILREVGPSAPAGVSVMSWSGSDGVMYVVNVPGQPPPPSQ